MPLLSELREFKASLANIGGQKANLAAKNIPMNDLKLPDTEAEPMVEPEPAAETAGAGQTEAAGGGGIDDLNFSDLINATPGELSVPDIADQSANADKVGDSDEQPASGTETTPGADDSFSPPDELLSDLSDGLEPVPFSDASEGDTVSGLENLDNLENFNFPETSAGSADASPPEPPITPASTDAPFPEDDSSGELDLSAFEDLGDFGNLGMPTEPTAAETEEPAVTDSGQALDLDNLGDLGDLDLPAEPTPADSDETPDLGDLGDLGDLDLPAEPETADSGETPDLGDLGDLDLPAEPETADAGATPDLDDLGDLDLPAEPEATDSGEAPDLGDLGDLDLPAEPEATDSGEASDLGDLGDLDLPAEPAAADSGEAPDLGDLGDLDLPAEPEAAETEEPATTEIGATPDLDDLGDLDLPTEPTPADSGEAPDLGDLDDIDLPAEPEAADAGATPDLDDLGDFDLPAEPEATDTEATPDLDDLGDLDLPAEPEVADSGEAPDLGDLGDFDLPAEPETAETEEPATADSGATPDLDDLGDLDLPAEPAAAEDEEPAAADSGEAPDLGDLGDFDLPAEPEATEDEEPATAEADDGGMPEIGDLDDLDLPEEPAAADDGEAPDLDNFGDLDLPSEPAAAEDEEPAAAEAEGPPPAIDLGNLDEQISADGLVETADKDAFEGFDPSGGVGWDKAPGETATDTIDTLDDIDDMSFPDLDLALGESPTDKKAPSAKAAKPRRKRGKQKDEIPFTEDEKDIELNDNELGYLQETLAGYPLNLRIACEEIIAEQDIRPEQMVRLIRNLIRGAPARETAQLASEILERPITIPRGFEKSSVEALEAEKGTFAYIFVHNLLPVLRLVLILGIVAACAFFLTYKFVYIPLKAESIYKMGYERIPEGEYQRANERFNEAFAIHPKKIWFFKYADAFIKERQYIYAEQKYDELLRHYPRDKLGVLYYAQLETKYLRNYAKADDLLRHQILDYNPDDPDALLALGDNSLEWGEIDPSKYEDARFSYARLIDMLGQQPWLMERMLKYFIRTDNLKEVLPIWYWFNSDPKKRPLGANTLSELGGYLLDKQLEEVKGVPNEYVALIDGVRDILLRAVQQDPSLPEPHYHLARYYKNLGNAHEERVTLEIALDRFEKAEEGNLRRLTNRIDAYQRYADNLIDSREFLHAEEQLQKGISLYDDAIARRLLSNSPQYGRLYAGLGDLEYFVKTGDMEAALRYYNTAQQNGWAPPDMQYRMGAAHYQLGNWQNALENFFAASSKLPQNRRILFSLGNSALKRGDYFAAQGYYNRLLAILENHRSRLPLLLPNDRPEYLDLAERLMYARNNAGVANEMLAARTGSRAYHSRAMSLYSESQQAWDSLTRDPTSMVRSPSTSLPYLNMRNVLYPRQNYEPQMFMRIDREASESSRWEQLAPQFKD